MIRANDRPARTRRNCLEQLENRIALSVNGITDYEQLMIELVNRARANPSAEASLHGTALNESLAANTISTAAKPALAPEQILSNTADAYSDRMLRDDFFDHRDPDGDFPWDRTEANGYPVWAGVGENIAWGTFFGDREATTHARHRSLFRSAGHRENMLDPDWNEVGVGITFGTTPYQSVTASDFDLAIVTENFGGRSNLKYLTGVAYDDSDSDDFYSVGEGLNGVTITATNSSGTQFTTTTSSSGGYAMQLAAGTYTVTANGNGVNASATTVTIGSGNVKVDFEPGSQTPGPAGAIGEVGKLTVPSSNTSRKWRTVSLNRNYANAVVVMTPVSNNDRDPAVVRVRNITANSFQYRIDEWTYQNDMHGSEQLGYMVVEAGSHDLPGGERLVAGKVRAGHNLVNVPLSGFSSAPNVIATVSSISGGSTVTPRIHNVSNSEFRIQVQEEEGGDQTHAMETLSYIAIESGSGESGNLDYIAGNTGRTVTHNVSSVAFGSRFSASPVFLASISSRFGGDTIALRLNDITANRADIRLQEEASRDSEIGHTQENVSFLAIEPGILVAGTGGGTNDPPVISNQTFDVDENASVSTVVGTVQASDPDGDALTYAITAGNTGGAFSIDASGRIRVANSSQFDTQTQYGLSVQVTDTESQTAAATVTIDINPVTVSTSDIGEVGTVTRSQASRSVWHTVNLNRTYANPVVVMGPLSDNKAAPAVVRVRNVTSNSFQWQIDEWDYLDGVHGSETASYMVMEAGTHTLSDGTRLVAGKTSATHNDTTVNLPGLSGRPIVLATTASFNGGAAVTTRLSNVSGSSFRVRLQEEERNDGFHARETVTFVAIEQGAGTANGTPFLVGSAHRSHTTSTVPFGTPFSAPPALFANMQSFNGADVASLRYRSLGSTGFGVRVAEEQSRDGELGHATERVGFFAIPTGTISVTNAGSAGVQIAEDNRGNEPNDVDARFAILTSGLRSASSETNVNESEASSQSNDDNPADRVFQQLDLLEALTSLF
ncbi:cadherin domain-containing protein [Planctomycetota bacterium]